MRALRCSPNFLPFLILGSLCAAGSISGCGSTVDDEAAQEVRQTVTLYMGALDSFADAVEELGLAVPGPVDDRDELSDAMSWAREIVATGRQRVNDYSDEAILNETYLEEIDQLVGSMNATVNVMFAYLDQLRSSRMDQAATVVIDRADRAGKSLVRVGIAWMTIRERIAE